MGFYAEWILPSLIDLSMRNKRFRPYRERTAGAAAGRILDIGIGSGLNLPFYAQQAREIFGLDPSPLLLARAQRKAPRTQTPVHLLEGSAERIPLADHSMDTIVMTWAGCSIPEICAALEESTTERAATAIACKPEAHCRSIVVPATVTGNPARIAALRATFIAVVTSHDDVLNLTRLHLPASDRLPDHMPGHCRTFGVVQSAA